MQIYTNFLGEYDDFEIVDMKDLLRQFYARNGIPAYVNNADDLVLEDGMTIDLLLCSSHVYGNSVDNKNRDSIGKLIVPVASVLIDYSHLPNVRIVEINSTARDKTQVFYINSERVIIRGDHIMFDMKKTFHCKEIDFGKCYASMLLIIKPELFVGLEDIYVHDELMKSRAIDKGFDPNKIKIKPIEDL